LTGAPKRPAHSHHHSQTGMSDRQRVARSWKHHGLLNPITANQWPESSYRWPSRRTSRRILAYR